MPTFSDMAEKHGIKPKTVTILEEQDFDSAAAVASISEDTLQKLPGITLGQQGLLLTWEDKLQAKPKPAKAKVGIVQDPVMTQRSSLKTLRTKSGATHRITRRRDESSSDTDSEDDRRKARKGGLEGNVGEEAHLALL